MVVVVTLEEPRRLEVGLLLLLLFALEACRLEALTEAPAEPAEPAAVSFFLATFFLTLIFFLTFISLTFLFFCCCCWPAGCLSLSCCCCWPPEIGSSRPEMEVEEAPSAAWASASLAASKFSVTKSLLSLVTEQPSLESSAISPSSSSRSSFCSPVKFIRAQ